MSSHTMMSTPAPVEDTRVGGSERRRSAVNGGCAASPVRSATERITSEKRVVGAERSGA
jgi:hypothetical protein